MPGRKDVFNEQGSNAVSLVILIFHAILLHSYRHDRGLAKYKWPRSRANIDLGLSSRLRFLCAIIPSKGDLTCLPAEPSPMKTTVRVGLFGF